ncbi:MAG TPA: carbamoyltransferase C-terminal domain-containing protein [Acidimicrobiales bacterium]|nr:carbamoyltransferase C-terminal domain-containing protein [Acidimicrobiales bacterium]
MRRQRPTGRGGPVREHLGPAGGGRRRHRPRGRTPRGPGHRGPRAADGNGRPWSGLVRRRAGRLAGQRPRPVRAPVRPGRHRGGGPGRQRRGGLVPGEERVRARALGHRSLLADPRWADNLRRLNEVKGREQFRPIAPMVLADRAGDVFEGVFPSPYMLFVHRVRPGWRDRIPAVVHVDGTARAQTVDRAEEPLVADLLTAFERRTGVPVLVNTSLNTAGRPMVDDPRDALECFGSAPVDVLVLGPFVVRRTSLAVGGR